MLFGSGTFFAFLALVYAGYRTLPHRGQNVLLLVASYVFYGWWDVRFLFLVAVSTAVNYCGGLLIHGGRVRRRERGNVSLWVLLSAFFFVVLQWRGTGRPGWVTDKPWIGVPPLGRGWMVFGGACAAVLVCNILHSRISSLSPERSRTLVLWLTVGANLAILACFKYYGFFVDNVAAILRGIGVNAESLRLDVALPVGISFYTLRGMTYPIDIHRRQLAPTASLVEFALVTAFFPLILAGPIERATRLLPQVARPRRVTASHFTQGLHLMFCGLFKKVAIADGVARTADAVFGAAGPVTWIDVVVGTFSYAIQLYCDFSGYSDMAIGTACLFGFDVSANFRFPYFSRSSSEFWSRWHISLSTWFRDYVFFPLGGPYGSTLRWVRNVLLTFLVTGLWHGAAWNFVLWGLYHGVLLCLQRGYESVLKRPARGGLVPRPLGVPLFFAVTCYGWILFRSQSLAQIGSITQTLLLDFGDPHLTAPLPTPAALFGLPFLAAAEFGGSTSRAKPLHEALPLPAWTAVYAGMLFALVMGSGAVTSQFVYFVF